MNFERLKQRQRAERGDWPEILGLRVHRALSWLQRAEQLEQQEDVDGQFILLWIAFNAAYATDIDEKYRESEQQTFRAFLAKLDGLDAGKQRFEHLVWEGERGLQRRLTRCQAARANAGTADVPAGAPRSRDSAASGPGSIRVLLDNPFVFGGEHGARHRLTECQAVRANAGTLRCRLVRRGAAVSRTATNAEALRPRPVHKRSRKRNRAAQRADGGREQWTEQLLMCTSVEGDTTCPTRR